MRAVLTFFFSLIFSQAAFSQPATCAAPGKDGITYSAPSYYPGTATVAAGATSISLGAILVGTGAGTTPLSQGDLVMIIQMQDAQYNNGNSIAYGDGSTGRGWTNLNNAGRYEFRRVVSFAAGTLVVDQGLTFAYTRAIPTLGAGAAENGNRRFQVIRVPQFSAVTLAGTLSPPAWNGETGGVWVIDVAGNLNMGGATIDASAFGFRGGAAVGPTTMTHPERPLTMSVQRLPPAQQHFVMMATQLTSVRPKVRASQVRRA